MGDSDEKVLCGSCHYDDKISKAVKWCTECSEGYCDSCLSAHRTHKLLRGHHVISIQDYLATKGLEVNKSCPEHARDLEFFCPAHDMVVCIICIQECHSKCKDIAPIKEVSKGVKDSTALSELEGDIESITGNLGEAFDQFKEQRKNLQDQQQDIKDKIKESRYQINSHFDILEKSVLSDLESNRVQIDKKISQKEKEMREKERMLQELKKKACDLKQFASESQVFIAIRSMPHQVNTLKTEIKTLMNCHCTKNLTYTKDANIDEIRITLGKVAIEDAETNMHFYEPKSEAAQVGHYGSPRVDTVTLNVSKSHTANVKYAEGVRCCLVLSNGSFLTASDFDKKKIKVWNNEEQEKNEINVSYNVFEMTQIDDHRIAVTSGAENKHIQLVDIKKRKEEKSILVRTIKTGFCGIFFYKEHFYAMASAFGVFVIDLDGKVLSNISLPKRNSNQSRLVVYNDRIFTSDKTGFIYCIDLKGNEIWTMEDPAFRSSWTSASLAISKQGFLFVAGYDSNTIHALSSDVKHKKLVLKRLHKPNAIHVDHAGEKIVVCNKNGDFSVYDISY